MCSVFFDGPGRSRPRRRLLTAISGLFLLLIIGLCVAVFGEPHARFLGSYDVKMFVAGICSKSLVSCLGFA